MALKYLILILTLGLTLPALSEEDHHDHDHHEEERHEDERHENDHSEDDHHDDHDDHGSSGVGEGKAILEVQKEGNRFKLSKESKEFLKISTAPIESLGGQQYRIPSTALVSYQKHSGIYIFDNEWFEIKEVKVISSDNGTAFVSAVEILAGSKVAVSGLGFLRAAHLQASGQGGQGHAH